MINLHDFCKDYQINIDYPNKVVYINGKSTIEGKDYGTFANRVRKVRKSFNSFTDAVTYCAWLYHQTQ
jgi:hypothetical protein